MKKVVVYLNQFFGGIGGENVADYAPTMKEGPVGPAISLNVNLKGGEVTHTVICGDNYMADYTEAALSEIGDMLEKIEMDLFVAGPAFMAGRYGMACSEVCNYVKQRFHIPVFTSMHEENPGKNVYLKELYVLSGCDNAGRMRKDIAKMATFANKILGNEAILWAEKEGYFPRGMRRAVLLEDKLENTAAERAFTMLLKKIKEEPFETEYPIVLAEHPPVARPITDMAHTTLAFITTGGIVPIDNPDNIPSASSTKFGRYDISKLERLEGGDLNNPKPGQWRTVHGGYDPQYVNNDPQLAVPLDVLHEIERSGRIGRLHPYMYSLTGNHTNKNESVRLAKEIIEYLKQDEVQAVILASY